MNYEYISAQPEFVFALQSSEPSTGPVYDTNSG